ELLMQQNKELQQQRQRIYAQNLKLIEASKLKSRFLATISHELRTPLNAIIGFSQILLRPSKGPLTPKQVEMVERIFNNGKHLLSLLTEVLDFSRIEAGHLDLSPQSFCLEDLVEDTIEELRSLAEQKHLRLFMQSSLESPLIVNDPSRVRQILVNLISNAIKFTEEGQVWVEIKDTSPEYIQIGVHDTGIGIASHQIDFIFEAFRQADQSETRKHPGTGLGLAITQTLVQLMEGEITLSSELGQGSTFWITIPRVVGTVCLTPDSGLLSTEPVMS
ncbi:MAG TPA: ATP-binding protein, partial [Stenomitos sp.]